MAQKIISNLMTNLNLTSKKVLVLGSGFVTRPTVQLLSDNGISVTVACRTLKNAENLCDGISNTNAISLDASKDDELDEQVGKHDLVISLIPYTYHATVIKSAIRKKKNVVTTSYVSDAMKALENDVKEAGITVMNEIGLDPGIDHLFAVKLIDETHKKGGKIISFQSYAGGLPAPECSDNPLGYKFSWSPRGVLLALRNTAHYLKGGKTVEVPGHELMGSAQPVFTGHLGYNFLGYANRDSTPYSQRYSIPEVQDCMRGTLRYGGFTDIVRVIEDMGFLSQDSVDFLSPTKYSSGQDLPTWAETTAKILGATSHSEDDITWAISSKTQFPDTNTKNRVVTGLKWIGMLSKTERIAPKGTPLDTLCHTLESKMQYEPGERDFVILQHTFGIEWNDGAKETKTSTLLEYGQPTAPGSMSAMAKLVGIPCGVATLMVLDGRISEKGILAPLTPELAFPLIDELKKFGIEMVEKTVI